MISGKACNLVSDPGQSIAIGRRHPAYRSGSAVFSDTSLWEAVHETSTAKQMFSGKEKTGSWPFWAILKGKTEYQEARSISYLVSMENPLSILSSACLA